MTTDLNTKYSKVMENMVHKNLNSRDHFYSQRCLRHFSCSPGFVFIYRKKENFIKSVPIDSIKNNNINEVNLTQSQSSEMPFLEKVALHGHVGKNTLSMARRDSAYVAFYKK